MDLRVDSAFRELIDRPDEEINLAEGALQVARTAYPELDAEHYLEQLDAMAGAVRARGADHGAPGERLRALNAYLFLELGFAGNTGDYYDPRNSFLNEVLERRLGIPLTLSIVYIEVGARLELPLAGISFPGHFLVAVLDGEHARVLDPFAGGSALDTETLRARLAAVRGREGVTDAQLRDLLRPAPARAVLARMLRNLKGVYLERGEPERCLQMVEHLIALQPEEPREIRDRALLYERLSCPAAAARDYAAYLERAPGASDAELIRKRLASARAAATPVH